MKKIVSHIAPPVEMSRVEFRDILDRLADAEQELTEWCSGGTRSWANLHTNDAEGWTATALHDAAHIQTLTAQVLGLRVLADAEPTT